MRSRFTGGLIVTTVLVLLGIVALPRLFEILNTRGRVLSSYHTPTGVKIFVVQRFTMDGDLFNTSFHARRTDGTWAWAYADHEDFFWSARAANVQIDTTENRVVVLRNGKPYLYYDWDDDAYFLNRFGRTTGSTDLWRNNRVPPAWWHPGIQVTNDRP